MAPGVGKTYRMLEEAHRRVARGTDLVVGFVETHGRPLTADLLDGLEVVPRRRIEYRGVVVEEMDTDAVLARRPTVALVDELAHTNVPGSPRAKRWEDVEADPRCRHPRHQHLQRPAPRRRSPMPWPRSPARPVNERLPDEVLEDADEVELVDMSPHALRQRMRHGNVYPPERTELALDRFFTETNLTALRELALRVVARSVDEQLDELAAGSPATSVALRRVVRADPRRRRRFADGPAGAPSGRDARERIARATPRAGRGDARHGPDGLRPARATCARTSITPATWVPT